MIWNVLTSSPGRAFRVNVTFIEYEFNVLHTEDGYGYEFLCFEVEIEISIFGPSVLALFLSPFIATSRPNSNASY